MNGVQTCALPICFPVTIWAVKHREYVTERLKEIVSKRIVTSHQKIITGGLHVIADCVIDKVIAAEVVYLSGTVTNNYGTVANNSGTVTYNSGTVTYNSGTVAYNSGKVAKNSGKVTNNQLWDNH